MPVKSCHCLSSVCVQLISPSGELYKQDGGFAIGSSVSPIIANLNMEHFEQLGITSAPVRPSVWFRYVDDTFVKIDRNAADDFTAHTNGLDTHIKFISEPEVGNKLGFLDSLVARKTDGTIKVTVYRKATHTDQYLDFNSHHPREHTISVVRTLFHRAETTVTDEADLKHEQSHVKSALKQCGYKQTVDF